MEYLLPIVKKSVAAVAWALAAASAGACVLSVLELLGAGISISTGSRPVLGLAFFCGSCAQVFFFLQMTWAALLAPWCVHVLLGRGGNEPLRLLSWASGFLGLSIFAERLAVFATGQPAWIDPTVAAVTLASALGLLILSSLPYCQAAPTRLKWALSAMAILYMAATVLDSPATFLAQDVATAVLGALQGWTARKLARLAPLIVSMPSREDDGPQ